MASNYDSESKVKNVKEKEHQKQRELKIIQCQKMKLKEKEWNLNLQRNEGHQQTPVDIEVSKLASTSNYEHADTDDAETLALKKDLNEIEQINKQKEKQRLREKIKRRQEGQEFEVLENIEFRKLASTSNYKHDDSDDAEILALKKDLNEIEQRNKQKEKQRLREKIKRQQEGQEFEVLENIEVRKQASTSNYEHADTDDTEILALKKDLNEIKQINKQKEKQRLREEIKRQQGQEFEVLENIEEVRRQVLTPHYEHEDTDDTETLALKKDSDEIKQLNKQKEKERSRERQKEGQEFDTLENMEDVRNQVSTSNNEKPVTDDTEVFALMNKPDVTKFKDKQMEKERWREEIKRQTTGQETFVLKSSKEDNDKIEHPVSGFAESSNEKRYDYGMSKEKENTNQERAKYKTSKNSEDTVEIDEKPQTKKDGTGKVLPFTSDNSDTDDEEMLELKKLAAKVKLEKMEMKKKRLREIIQQEQAKIKASQEENIQTCDTSFQEYSENDIENDKEEKKDKTSNKIKGEHIEEASKNSELSKSCLDDSDIENFVKRVGLGKFYQGKLNLLDIMKVESNINERKLTSLGRFFLTKLIMINFNSRDKIIQDFLREIPAPSQSSRLFRNTSCLDDLLGNDAEDNPVSVNPLDLIFAVFKCSTPMLSQVLASKLFICQLAIPIILPPLQDDLCKVNIWPLRSITIESRTENGITQNNAVTCPCHVVSFVRFKRPSFSKSKLLNEILYDQYHNSFLNKDCPLGTTKRSISDGLVEASWYLPSKKSSSFKNVTMFLNLRGDSCLYRDRLYILTKMSNVLVAILDLESLADPDVRKSLAEIQNSYSRLLLAIDTKHHEKVFVKETLQSYLLSNEQYQNKNDICVLSKDGQDRSTSIIKDEMRGFLRALLQTEPIETFIDTVNKKSIRTDEDEQDFEDTKATAMQIIAMIPEGRPMAKEELVPLQGKLWHSYSEKAKDVNKSSQHRTLQERGKLEKEMQSYREKQAHICNELGSFMKCYLCSLQKSLSSESKCALLISWLKLFLDERSRKVIPKFLSRYQSDWQTLMSFRDKKNVSMEQKEEMRKAVNESEVNLAEASFGFEHLCREMGQIYEALAKYEPKRTDLVSMKNNLPQLAAKLLFLGQPFEIMDGDAANVPISWVSAVLKSLKEIIDDKRVLALSVLGIQSSGKSTLLNAMFGLQFAVSAGRCTRGVFMQMVEVNGTEFPFDFVLVIDTEGLRAPELAHQKHTHDNELATFVIGLGDITIVNIKGENTAEVQDVLQIAVHAFLRLKLANQGLNLKQSCVFVHQNVPALDASDKMMHGRQKFIETLDAMTKEAADQENITEIKSFNQVIEFDSEKNVWYFSDLWRGDPPMAPANPSYSENVWMVKDAILHQLTKRRETYLTISNTICRIQDLWDGILKDDFVFSFRNSLEFKAYASIERRCNALIWQIEKFILEFVKSEAQMTLVNCNEDELHTSVPKIVLKLKREVNKLVFTLLKEFETFIQTNSLKDVMIQWKQSKINRINLKEEELISKAQLEINNTKEEIRIRKLQTSQQRNHETEINKKAMEMALSMKGQTPHENVMKQKFDAMWNIWVSKFNTQDTNNTQGIVEAIEESMMDSYKALGTYMNQNEESANKIDYSRFHKLEGSLKLESITNTCFDIHKGWWNYRKKIKPEKCRSQAMEITNAIFRKIDTKLHEHAVEDTRFNISYVRDIFIMITKELDEHNNQEGKKFDFNLLPPFRVLLISHVAGYAAVFFTNLQDAYNNKHSPKAQMEAYKSTAWTLFKNMVDSKTEEVIAMGFFKEAIITETKLYVSQILPIDAQDRIMSAFSNGKYSLIKKILTDENVIENFDKLKSYIMDPSGFAKSWVSNLADVLLFDTNTSDETTYYCRLAEKRTSIIFESLEACIRKATSTVKPTIIEWIDIFVEHNTKSNELPLSRDVLLHVERRNVNDCTSFGELLLDSLDEMKNSVLDDFKWVNARNVMWTSNPVSSVMQKLWGCAEKCMFCHEPCMNSDGNHVQDGHPHKCLQHRPEGIIGFHWTDSGKLVVEFCNHLVESNKTYTFNDTNKKCNQYRKYKEEFPDWEIAPNSDVSKYWMWIMLRYKKEFVELYDAGDPDIPVNWSAITKQEALGSL